ncbi:hypothetical protein JTB14_003234 [Gonioctena quinquepunctata]|nr:hypothetical protein JTB14_003234 [Gonioctena quinquepunctata]
MRQSAEKHRNILLTNIFCVTNWNVLNPKKMAGSTCSNGYRCNEDEEMSSYKKDALSVVTFKIIYDEENFKKSNYLEFKPAMAHQIFGESENIFGYRSLSISLYYLHNSSRCYVEVKASGEIKHALNQPDDIMENLNPWLPENYTTEKELFLKMLDDEKHSLIFGTVLNEFKSTQKSQLFPNHQVYASYKTTLCDTADCNFKDFHRRFETYIIWYIDGANFIDLDDERWLIFYIYEEITHPETQQHYITPVGFCSIYKFFLYPNNIRARISQFFVLPSHQRRGIGKALYQTVFRKLREMPEIADITVEEPTATFQRIRDADDCLVVYKSLKESGISLSTSNLKRMFEVMKKFKICKKQSQRLYDILGAFEASSNEGGYKNYLARIKNRVRTEIERETKGSKRLCNSEGASINVEHADKNVMIEAEFKKYIGDIEQSMKNFQGIVDCKQ